MSRYLFATVSRHAAEDEVFATAVLEVGELACLDEIAKLVMMVEVGAYVSLTLREGQRSASWDVAVTLPIRRSACRFVRERQESRVRALLVRKAVCTNDVGRRCA